MQVCDLPWPQGGSALGPVPVLRLCGGPLQVRHPGDASYRLLVNLCGAWTATQASTLQLHPGDGVLIAPGEDTLLHFPTSHELCVLTLADDWLRDWLPDPPQLAGQRVAADAGWGRALSAFIAQLKPAVIDNPPVPPSLLASQLGSLLALVAADATQVSPSGETNLHERLRIMIAQRCTEPELGVSDIALAVGVSVRTVHRVLARFEEGFAPLLIAARARAALRMLESPQFDRFTTAQIGQRAGFKEQSHFTRTMREKFGATPTRLRRDARQG